MVNNTKDHEKLSSDVNIVLSIPQKKFMNEVQTSFINKIYFILKRQFTKNKVTFRFAGDYRFVI